MPYVCENDMGSAPIVFSKQVDLCTQSSGTMRAKTENAVTREWRVVIYVKGDEIKLIGGRHEGKKAWLNVEKSEK
eukprot:scaffold106461_cov40-Attheya_sp.AAC.1